MKRIHSKQSKQKQKISLRKRVTPKITTNNIQKEAESLQLQYTASLHNKNDSNEDLPDGLLNNDQEYETLEQFCNSESDFSMSSDELNNSEWSDTLDHEANQKTSDDLTDSEELINMEVIQETIEGKTKFEPLPGEYGPYFQNFTEMMLFTWITKHMISTKAYDDLICILKHPNFRTEHIIENVRRLRLLRNRLPLQTVKSHSIPIQNMKTPSTSKPFKDAYTISVTEHIKRVLENENLQSQMYFGPGVETDIKKEFWDGNLWQESPLFGQFSIWINQVLYTAGSFVKYKDKRTRIGRIIAIVSTSSDVKLKIQVLYYCDELPNNFRKLSRVQGAENGELWLSEVTSLINKDNIIEPIAVWLQDSLHLSSYQFYVKEILYSYEGRWKIRNVELRHHHPCEYTKIPSTAPQNILTLKLIFVPFGGDFNDVMKPIINEIKSLEKGVLMTINQQNIWVIAALGVITADLPQGNDLADTKRHGGNLGCRSCLVPKDQLTDFTFDVILKARRSLAISHIKDFELNLLKEQLISSTKSCPRPAQIINIIISFWVAVAKVSCLSFSFTFTEQTYKELKDALRIEHDILLKNIELDFIRRYNTLQTIRHLIDDGKDDRFSTIGQGFLNLTTDPLLHPLLSDWYIMRDIQKETTTNDIAALIYRQVKFYKQISYTLLDDNGKFNSHLNLNIGAIVQIKEESGISYYAIIKAIFTHKYNDDLTRAFIRIDWMQESSTVDPILQCPIYELQKAENMRWYRVHPITTIDSHLKVHFLHNCRSTCTSDLHDALNNQYFKNEFFYTAI
ncbi:unnamed protein product [Rhizophagus irregularis]|uniref:BAH domain-containing protein n=1 Tax=Rhizophagus irregularis TaxID=588596 RepID=A0A915ZLN1_9GLOM|nr:unnamed protein product [Rhizophagus irregularis]